MNAAGSRCFFRFVYFTSCARGLLRVSGTLASFTSILQILYLRHGITYGGVLSFHSKSVCGLKQLDDLRVTAMLDSCLFFLGFGSRWGFGKFSFGAFKAFVWASGCSLVFFLRANLPPLGVGGGLGNLTTHAWHRTVSFF